MVPLLRYNLSHLGAVSERTAPRHLNHLASELDVKEIVIASTQELQALKPAEDAGNCALYDQRLTTSESDSSPIMRKFPRIRNPIDRLLTPPLPYNLHPNRKSDPTVHRRPVLRRQHADR